MSTVIKTGAQAVKQIYEQSLLSSAVDFVCLSSNYEAVMGDWFDREYSPKLYDGQRVTREILPESQANRDYAETKPTTSTVKYLTNSVSQTDIVITSTWVALVSFNADRPEVTVFDDSEVIKSFHIMFELSWKQAGE